jgi:hypothetical protein
VEGFEQLELNERPTPAGVGRRWGRVSGNGGQVCGRAAVHTPLLRLAEVIDEDSGLALGAPWREISCPPASAVARSTACSNGITGEPTDAYFTSQVDRESGRYRSTYRRSFAFTQSGINRGL